MKTAGVVIDFYDDPNGTLLRRLYPTIEELPEVVKEAHILTPEEHGVLRNEAYALILHDEGKQLRKFACVDPGNTFLAALYFHENADKLPQEAVKVAAANIAAFCQEFDMEPTDFLKMASAEGGGMTLTDDKKDNPPSEKNPIRQTTKANQSPERVTTRTSDGSGAPIVGENLASTLWPKVANVVDVSGLEPETFVQKHSSANTALEGMYPLDSFGDVQAAIDYFRENWVEFSPRERHEYTVKTAARADELGIEVDELMERYGSTSYAPDVEAHLAARKANCDQEFHRLFDMLKEKRSGINPEQFAELLGEADKAAGLHYYYGNGAIFDPYLSTFGGMSEKKASAAYKWMGRVGDTVNADQLHKLAVNGRGIMLKNFSKEIVDAFQKDPITIFESLPDTSKVVTSRLANGEFDAEPMN